MPFHNFAEKKYKKLGRGYFFKGFPDIPKEDVQDYLEIIKNSGPWQTSIGGMIGSDKKENQSSLH
jgi:pyruvate formate lyase activating enzyme